MEKAVKKFLEFVNKSPSDSKELFSDVEAKKVSIQVVLHKIPNLINEKQVLCKLPNPLVDEENPPEVCLIVKDIDKKDRDYERTVRKYTQILKSNNLQNIVKKVIPLKQLNLEFRPFEAKRVLSTSFDVFLSDKCLHDILFNGSKLGKEFRKRRRMPIEIDVENSSDLRETVLNALNSTIIRLTGKGAIIDINAFLSNHTAKQALENINAIKATLAKSLPGGEPNIKAIYLKSTNTPALPIYTNETTSPNDVDVPNNLSAAKKLKSKKLNKIKRLQQKPKKNKTAKTTKISKKKN